GNIFSSSTATVTRATTKSPRRSRNWNGNAASSKCSARIPTPSSGPIPRFPIESHHLRWQPLRRMSHLKRAREVFDIELAGLKAVRAQLDAAFDRAVDLVVSALRQRGKIVVVGIGKSGNVGQKIAATLTSTGSTRVMLPTVDALHGDLGIVADGDAILALSYSGETEELLNMLTALKRFSVKIISVTGAFRL